MSCFVDAQEVLKVYHQWIRGKYVWPQRLFRACNLVLRAHILKSAVDDWTREDFPLRPWNINQSL